MDNNVKKSYELAREAYASIGVDTDKVLDAINDPEKFVVVNTAPSIRVTLGECFGNTVPPCQMTVPYTVIDEDDYWDGDSNSPTYNTHVKGSEMSAEWLEKGEYEHLIRYTNSYKYAAMINYNVDPAVPNKGSAIFLHIPSPGSTSSAGCVVIPEEYMIKALEMMRENTVIAIFAK